MSIKEHKREYGTWYSMRKRCRNKNSSDYKYYGGRGIKVDKNWENFDSFYKDMGKCPEGFSLDRIDNNKNYSKSNCRWVSHTKQMNNKSSNRMLTFKGKTQSMSEWSKETGLNYNLIRSRLRYGWTIKDTLTLKSTFNGVPVIQFTLNDLKIKKHISMAEAARAINISESLICMCCSGKKKQAGGFKWKKAICP